MMTSSSRFIRHAYAAAAFGMGTLALLTTADRANAQQMASAGSNRAAHLAAKCDHLQTKPAEHAGCYAEEAIRFERARGIAADRRGMEADRRGAEADRRAAAEDALRPCLLFLKQKKDAGLALDRPVTRENACAYARELGMKEPG